MQLQFVSNDKSPFYQSQTFAKVISFAAKSVRRTRLYEHNGHRLMTVKDVPSVEDACHLLEEISK
jgi:transcription-repair coupling factor (superfamily II helicase)